MNEIESLLAGLRRAGVRCVRIELELGERAAVLPSDLEPASVPEEPAPSEHAESTHTEHTATSDDEEADARARALELMHADD